VKLTLIASGTRESKYNIRLPDTWMKMGGWNQGTDGWMDGCEVSHHHDKNAFGTRLLYALNLGKRQKGKTRRLCHTKRSVASVVPTCTYI
jgi:hypothetical protein